MKKFILVSLLLTFSFFFLNISSAHAATLYYDNATLDGDWNTLGNWTTGVLPTDHDDVFVSGDVTSNTGPAAIINCNTMTVNGTSMIAITLSVANDTTFNDTSNINALGTINGDVIFNDDSFNRGMVNGDAVFNGTSHFGGTISGNALLNDSSYNNGGMISGGAVFNDLSQNSGTVSLDATFNGSSVNNQGTVSGNATFNDTSYNSCDSTVSGNATFNNASHNNVHPLLCFGDDAAVTGNATFNDTSYNDGDVNTDAVFNNSTINYGTVLGNTTFNDTSYNDGTVSGIATFYDSSYNSSSGVVSDGGFFYDNGYNSGNVVRHGSMELLSGFYDSSENTVTGDVGSGVCFALTATNNGTVENLYPPCSVSLPVVTTSSVLPINSAITILQGEIIDTGGESNFELGFEYGLTTNYGNTVYDTGAFVRGAFDLTASSLACDTTYHYRAYAKNYIERDPVLSIGTGYGDDETFTTSPCENNQVLYGIDGAGGNPEAPNLYTLDPATGEILTIVGPVGFNIAGLAFDPVSGNLYATTGGQDPTGGHTKSLIQIDTITGAGTWLGALREFGGPRGPMNDIAFRSDGRLYGISADDGNLYLIDPTSCTGLVCSVSKVGDFDMTMNWGNGLAFDSNDNLYLFSNYDSSYFSIDPDTGLGISEYTITNPSGYDPVLNDAAFNKNDLLYATRYNYGDTPADLVIINQDTNTIISTGEDNPDMVYMVAIAFSPTTLAVVTSSASSVTKHEATLNGEIINTGGATILERGFEYGLDTSYGTTISEATGPYLAGEFSLTPADLLCGTVYHYRAYATNIVGTSYGEGTRFNTTHCVTGGGNLPDRTPIVTPPTTLTPTTPTTPAIPSAPTCSITRTLMRGSTGDEVKCLQQGLNQRLNTNLVIDGIFGPLTQAAVIRFQLANSLKGDGVFGILSRGAWNK